MSERINKIVEAIKQLTLIEAGQLVDKIEEEFGVDAAELVSSTMVVPMGDSPEEVLKSEFNVVLDEVPAASKIAILKVVRSLTGLGLKEAKELVESAPKVVLENLIKEVADDAKSQIEAAGGKVSLT